MTWLEAAEKVLKVLGRPARLPEIVEVAHDKKYRRTEPYQQAVNSLRGDLTRLIVAEGNQCVFMRTKPGTFGLSEWRLDLLKATERVLQDYSGGKPMSYRQITNKATELGFLRKAGSPWKSLSSRLTRGEPNRLRRPGEKPRFTVSPKSLVGLIEWTSSPTPQEVRRQNTAVAKRLLVRLAEQMTQRKALEVEHKVAALLRALGFKSVVVISGSVDDQAGAKKGMGDKGIDVRGKLRVNDLLTIQVAVQVKAQRDNIRRPVIQSLRGSLATYELGLFVTTGGFSIGAKREASRKTAAPIALVAGPTLGMLLVAHNIGVNRMPNGFVYIA